MATFSVQNVNRKKDLVTKRPKFIPVTQLLCESMSNFFYLHQNLERKH